jgi:hypothetical protein
LVYFQTKNPNLGKFCRVLHWKMLVCFNGHLVIFPAIWYILWHFGIFYGTLVHFIAIWYILWHFGIFYCTLVYFMALWYIFPILLYLTTKNMATLVVT